MSNIYKARTDSANPVYLPMVNDSTFQDFTLEPQYVRVRANNSANLIFNSTDIVVTTSNPTNIVLTQYGSPSSIMMRKAKRLALTKISLSHSISNINENNNKLTVFRADSNSIIPIILPINNFTTPADLMTYLITVLNGEPLLAGINFAFLPSIGFDNIYQLYSVAGIKFCFSPLCSAVAFGYWTFGFPYTYRSDFVETVASLIALSSVYQTIGPINLTFSPFIDFTSTALTSYTKAQNVTTGNGAKLLGRLQLRRWNGADTQSLKNRNYEVEIENPVWFSWNPEENINAIDFQLIDDVGRLLPLPLTIPILSSPSEAPMQNNFFGLTWSLTFNVEI
jgi:hypothetical protein